ncbi:MAG: AAA family ATPase [Luteolibacter sp.]
MISRTRVEAEVRQSLVDAPVTTLHGPRQCGKTTLAREIARQAGATFFDMQDPEVVSAFQNPKLVLSPLEGLVILDEAHLVTALYPVLRILVQRQIKPTPDDNWTCSGDQADLCRARSRRSEGCEVGGAGTARCAGLVASQFGLADPAQGLH